VTAQLKMTVTVDPDGKLGNGCPPASAPTVIEPQSAPPVALQVRDGQANPVAVGSVTTAPLASDGPLLTNVMV